MGPGANAAVRHKAVTCLKAADGGLKLGAVDDAHAVQAGTVGGREVTLGHQPLDQHGNPCVAHAGLDSLALAEGGPAAVADQAAIADIAGGQVGIADVSRGQSLEPVDEAVLGEGVVQPEGQVDAIFLHLPQVLDGLGTNPALGENAAVAHGGGGGAHLGGVRHRCEGLEIKIVTLRQAVALGTAGGGLKRAEAFGCPDGTPAVQLIEGADIGLYRGGQARQLIVEAVIEGNRAGIPGLGSGRQSDG